MNGIPLYHEINDLHQLTGSPLRTNNPLFHCFDMSRANDLEVTKLPPHRTDFYTLALNCGTRDLDYTLNGSRFESHSHFLLCVAPGQVATWEKQGDWFGYCTFFKSEFLNFSKSVNFLQQYPFFNIAQTNFFEITEADFRGLRPYFKTILLEQEADSPFNKEIIQSAFQTILWMIRRIYERVKNTSPSSRAHDVIASQFQFLVNEHFLSKTTVDEYAEMLNISSNHLSQSFRAATGLTAKSIIIKRRLDEAKYLLKYTASDATEISYRLGFSEPTHFTKFFKKETGLTPLQYRVNPNW